MFLHSFQLLVECIPILQGSFSQVWVYIKFQTYLSNSSKRIRLCWKFPSNSNSSIFLGLKGFFIWKHYQALPVFIPSTIPMLFHLRLKIEAPGLTLRSRRSCKLQRMLQNFQAMSGIRVPRALPRLVY